MAEAKNLKELMIIRAHNREKLDSINSNLGTALGFKKPTDEKITNNPAIIVFVPQKINPKWIPNSQLIPDKLMGPDDLWCEVDVVEGGKIEKENPVEDDWSELAERLRGWDEKVWSGSQISRWEDQDKGFYSMGTLGAFVKTRKEGKLGLLTNQHVGQAVGQKMYHPVPWGTHLATTKQVIEYSTDEEYYGKFTDEPDTFVRVDCAFAEIDQNFNKNSLNFEMMSVGKLGKVKNISLDTMDIIGQKVLRVGRTTGKREGTITAFGYKFMDDKNVTAYTDLLIAGDNNTIFSTHGDSGSLIVTNDEDHNPIGLLWGGWEEKLRTGYGQENWTYGIMLERVLNLLDIDIVN